MKCTHDQKEDLSEVFADVKDVDEQILSHVIEIFRKQNKLDCIRYLSIDENEKHLEQQILQIMNLSSEDMEENLYVVRNNIKIIHNILKKIQEHDFNRNNFSDEKYFHIKENIKKKIQENREIIQFFQFLVHLTAIDDQFIVCGSNSLNLLIKNTSLIGVTLVGCNLSGSEFNNVDISGINLNGALLFNCKWKNIKIHELNNLEGLTKEVLSVCFSPDDKSIRIWDVKTEKENHPLDTRYKNILAEYKTPIFEINNPLSKDVNSYVTILLISQKVLFQAQGAVILKGQFENQSGIDLKTLFKQKGCLFLQK